MILPSIQATEALRITGAELQKLEVVDEVIPVRLNL
jgi:acetyl-CoA carboxylase alpha subunit